jgi:tetratricopeptide (TPR) repeat protein
MRFKGVANFAIAMFLTLATTGVTFAQCQYQQSTKSGFLPRRQVRPVYVQPAYQQLRYIQPVPTQAVPHVPLTYNSSPSIAGAPFVAPVNNVQNVNKLGAVDLAKLKARELAKTAKLHFRQMDYAAAKPMLDQVVELAPNDNSAWQFRSLNHFAQGSFEDAAADAYDAMRLGNAWTKTGLKGMYGDDLGNYQQQLARLTSAVENHSTMQGHFLLAYHNMMNNRLDESKKHLSKVLELEPAEPLSTKLVVAIDQRLTAK